MVRSATLCRFAALVLPASASAQSCSGVAVVFSADQNGTNPRFVEFARGANLLIMHMAIAAGATNPLHAAPAVVGRIAQEAGVGRPILSHIGQLSLLPKRRALRRRQS